MDLHVPHLTLSSLRILWLPWPAAAGGMNVAVSMRFCDADPGIFLDDLPSQSHT
jgi:hypothetical protein